MGAIRELVARSATVVVLVGAVAASGCGDGGTPRADTSAPQLAGVYDGTVVPEDASRGSATIIAAVGTSTSGELSITLFFESFDVVELAGQLLADDTVHLEGFETNLDESIELSGDAEVTVTDESLRIMGSIDRLFFATRRSFTMERPRANPVQHLSGEYLFTFSASGVFPAGASARLTLTFDAGGTGSSTAAVVTDATATPLATFDAGSAYFSPRGTLLIRSVYRSLRNSFIDSVVLGGELRGDPDARGDGGCRFMDLPRPPPPSCGGWTASLLEAAR